MYAVSFAVDRLGDIYLDARLPLAVGRPPTSSTGCSARCSPTPTGRSTPSSSSASRRSIRKEWEWRNLRGESTRNLEAFRGWLETGATPEPDAPSLPAWTGPSSTCGSGCGEVLLRGVTDADLEALAVGHPRRSRDEPRQRAVRPPRAGRRPAPSAGRRDLEAPGHLVARLLVPRPRGRGRTAASVGVQALEGEQFPQLRDRRLLLLAVLARCAGRGLANLMRAGVLALAFDHLGAEVAVSSARTDNPPSLAVSLPAWVRRQRHHAGPSRRPVRSSSSTSD